jgi:hypothetical protein
MSPETFTLLQNEGYLMQGCFKSSLRSVLKAPSGEPGPFYSAFFNYAIGLERLLKVLLMLDHWHDERKFLDNAQLKKFGGKSGHNVAMLHASVLPLFPKYHVERNDEWELDSINNDLLNFLADFANGSRYFNLDQLAGSSNHAENPIYRWQRLFYRAYAHDHPKAESIVTKPDVPEDTMSTSELARHHVIMMATRPHICWRLVHLLIPLQSLLIAIGEQVHNDDLAFGGADTDSSMPFMEEFLDFVSEDKSIILESEDWP